ncbi:MAG: hypothetical protein GY842_27145 [bacterium]|nr:hypothetical protein [bacterium]
MSGLWGVCVMRGVGWRPTFWYWFAGCAILGGVFVLLADPFDTCVGPPFEAGLWLVPLGGAVAFTVSMGVAKETRRPLVGMDLLRIGCWTVLVMALVGGEMGATYCMITHPDYAAASRATGLAVTGACLLLIVGTTLLFPTPRLHLPPCCSTCGYDLTGNESGRCSECGTEITHDHG